MRDAIANDLCLYRVHVGNKCCVFVSRARARQAPKWCCALLCCAILYAKHGAMVNIEETARRSAASAAVARCVFCTTRAGYKYGWGLYILCTCIASRKYDCRSIHIISYTIPRIICILEQWGWRVHKVVFRAKRTNAAETNNCLLDDYIFMNIFVAWKRLAALSGFCKCKSHCHKRGETAAGRRQTAGSGWTLNGVRNFCVRGCIQYALWNLSVPGFMVCTFVQSAANILWIDTLHHFIFTARF